MNCIFTWSAFWPDSPVSPGLFYDFCALKARSHKVFGLLLYLIIYLFLHSFTETDSESLLYFLLLSMHLSWLIYRLLFKILLFMFLV